VLLQRQANQNTDSNGSRSVAGNPSPTSCVGFF